MTLFAAPELTLHQSVQYVAGAYIVFLAIILTYVVIMAVRQRRTDRALVELRRELLAREQLEQRPQLHDQDAVR